MLNNRDLCKQYLVPVIVSDVSIRSLGVNELPQGDNYS